MVDGSGGTIANLTLDALKSIAMAGRQGPAAVAAQVEAIAAQLGVSPAVVIRGVAVSMGAASKAIAGWGGTATAAVQSAMEAGTLVKVSIEGLTAGSAAAGGAAAGGAAAGGAAAGGAAAGGAAAGGAAAGGAAAGGAAAGGAAAGGWVTTGVTWFGGLTVAAKVAVVAAVVGGTVLVAQGAGWLSSDSPSAVPGSGPGTTAEFGPGVSSFQEAYQGVGVYSDGVLRIISVRGTEAIAEGIPGCEFRHGGIDCTTPADVRTLTAEFGTAADASAALCEQFAGPITTPALADGWVIYQGDRSVTLDDWGSIDWGVCEEALG
ncbi:MAG: hypothetical protein QY307_04220 [Acidimicrobiia bacterium]|nr:MAG: hypothetical protein QY307_04220 [Acidimicrobiia bacterium]